jgi:hypothetical protein
MAPENAPGDQAETRRLWREWAGSLGPAHLAELGAQAAIDLLLTGATVAAAQPQRSSARAWQTRLQSFKGARRGESSLGD